MGNSTARLRPDTEHHQPPPDYEPNKDRLTLTIYSGGKIKDGVYCDGDLARNIYKYDNVLIEDIKFKSIKKSAENLYAGKEFSIWTLVGGELRNVRDDNLLKEACEALGRERDLHIYVVDKSEVDHAIDGVENSEDEESLNISEFSDSDEQYEYDMRDESESEYEQVNVFEREGARENVYAGSSKRKGKKKVIEVAPDTNSEGDDHDVNVIESGEDLASPKDSDEESVECFPTFNPENIYKPVLQLGMVFSTRKELKMAIQSYAINDKRSIKIIKNDKRRLYAECTNPNCPWILRGVPADGPSSFRIRELVHKHTCKAKTSVTNVSSTWLANKYKEKFVNDPDRDMNAWRVETISELKVHVTQHQAYRTKYTAKKLIEGSPEKQYEMLWSFGEEIKRSNPGSTVVIETDGSGGRNLFDRMYVCLHALKEGFINGCRPVIFFDGCWLKGTYGGILLTACGVDANNSYLPIAYAAVEKENTEIWGWFFRLLKEDLKIYDTSKYTLMSDKQKGLIQAEVDEFPGAEYRYCARHLAVNFQRAGFRGNALKRLFWRAAKCTTVNSFEKAIDEIQNIDPKAADWLKDKPPTQWCRAYFREFPMCDVLTNNACETFNANILTARKMPILSMFEQLHTYLMSRFAKNRSIAAKSKRWKDVLCPRIQEILDGYDARIPDYVPIAADDYHFQVSSIIKKSDQYAVNLKDGVCGCRKWQISGMPCIHAIVALNFQNFDVEPYIHKCYEVATYKRTYSLPILPMNGIDEWPKTNHLPIIAPIVVKRRPGRPRTERRLEHGENASKERKKKCGRPRVLAGGTKIKRNQVTVKCSKCGKTGHNARGCKQQQTQTNVDEADIQEGPIAEVEMHSNMIMAGDTVQEEQMMEAIYEAIIQDNQACVEKVVNNREERGLKITKAVDTGKIDASVQGGGKAVVWRNMAANKSNLLEKGKEVASVEGNVGQESEQTLLSQMSDVPPMLSQVEESQKSMNLVIPAELDPNRKVGSYADLSGPVPIIIKDGQHFMSLSNIIKMADKKRQKK